MENVKELEAKTTEEVTKGKIEFLKFMWEEAKSKYIAKQMREEDLVMNNNGW